MAIAIRPITTEKSWEGFIKKHSPHALFQSWAWGETQETLGKQVWRYGFYRDSTRIGVAQVVKVEARRGTFLHVRHGPVLIDHSARTLRSVLRHLTTLARRENAWFVRMNPLLEPQDALRVRLRTLGLRSAAIHAMDAEHTLELDLSKSEDDILSDMRKTTRYEIKRAKKDPRVSVTTSKDQVALDEFFALYEKTSKRKGFVRHTGIREEYEAFSKRDQASFFLGMFDGQVSAVALILYYQDSAIYHHGASVHTEIPLTHLLQWESIKAAKRKGLAWYNLFGISDIKNRKHPWYGTTVFKRGFGGVERKYLHAQDYPISLLYYLTRTVETVRRIKRGY